MNIKNMSDEELMKIAKGGSGGGSHVSAMSDEELMKIAGINPAQAQPDSITNFDPEHNPIAKTLASLGLGVLQSGADLAGGAGNLAIKGINALGGNVKSIPKAPLAKLAPYPAVATGGEVLGGLATPLGGVNALSKAYQGVKALPKLAAAMGDAATTGAAYNTLYGAADPNSSMATNALMGGAGGALVRGAIGAPATAVNALTQRLADKASHGLIRTPEEAAKVYEKIQPLAGDAKVDLGSLLGDKGAARYYHSTLANTYGGGGNVELNQHKLIGAADNEANQILGDLRGGIDRADVPDVLHQQVNQLKRTHGDAARDMFQSITKDAEDRGLTIKDFPSARQYAQQILNEEKNVLASGVKGELRNVLDKLSGKINVDKNQESSKPYAAKYSQAHFSHSNLGKLGDELAAKQEYRSATVANTLQEKLRQDIEQSLKQSGNQDLFDRWQEAKSYFAQNVVPFRQKSLTKILAGEKPNSQLAKELLSGKNNAILNMLDQPTKNLIGHEQFTKYLNDTGTGEKSISVNNLTKAFGRLDNQRNTNVIQPEIKERVNSLNALNKVISEARLTHNTPPTGFRNNPVLQDIGKYAALAGTMAVSNPMLGALGAAGKIGADKLTEKLLTSNALRNAYINQRFGNSQKEQDITNALLRALASGAH